MKKLLLFLVMSILFQGIHASAQAPDFSQLDGQPYDIKSDPDIDMFFSSWKESMPRHSFGSLIERDIFTACGDDPLHPDERGAVLSYFKRFSHASLHARGSTTPTALDGEQIIFYIDSGHGKIKTDNKTDDLYEGIGVIMPPGLEFILENSGDEPLTMYVIVEAVKPGFKANTDMLVRDENVLPVAGEKLGHWNHIYKKLFWKDDGLATAIGMGPVWFDPMTMGQPHSHNEGNEEIWFALNGNITILLGKEIRKLEPGSAYKVPPNGNTPHSTINVTDKPIKVFWLMKVPD
ncbi:cupin domain-containing protein [Candidatus Omnitrophota bacterium]